MIGLTAANTQQNVSTLQINKGNERS